MQSLPILDEPFERVSFDIVGPFPGCAGGYRFLLTAVDHCTHFPFAIALKKHEAQDVANALIEVSAQYSYPKEVLCANAPEFRSKLHTIFWETFGIKHVKISNIHPTSNSNLERCHRLMKNALRSVADKLPDSWTEAVPWVLYAYREVPVEPLGFRPYELLFG